MSEELSHQLEGKQGLEQFLLLAKTATGAAASQLIMDAISSKGVYVFSELLEMENIQSLKGTEHESYLELLRIFAYGTYSDYKNNLSSLPRLLPAQLIKIKHLTILSLASKNRTLSYSTLLEELEVNNVRELEDLIIEAIYRNILHAKLDQSNHQLEVDSFIGRDIQLEQLDNMLDKLDQWCSNCASVIQIMEQEMVRANELKSNNNKQKESLEQEIKSLRQAVSVAQDFDQQTTSSSEAFDSQHKFQKKGLRGSLARSKS